MLLGLVFKTFQQPPKMHGFAWFMGIVEKCIWMSHKEIPD